MKRLRAWWRSRQMARARARFGMADIGQRVDQLASEFRRYATMTDLRLEVQEQLLNRTLRDLNTTLADLAASQHRLADSLSEARPDVRAVS